jgi:hypothetical protein
MECLVRVSRSRLSVSGRLLIVATLLAMAVAAPVAAQTTATSFSGSATGIIAVVNSDSRTGAAGFRETLVVAGPLPAKGGQDDDELLDLALDVDAVTADVVRAETQGGGNRAESTASILGLDVSVFGLVDVTSSTLGSNATAACGPNGAEIRGSSVVEELAVNGTEITVNGNPNQTISEGGITVIINEQEGRGAPDGSSAEVTVNALHVIVEDPLRPDANLVDIILAQSHADVVCMLDTSTDGSTDAPASPAPFVLLLLGAAGSAYLIRPLVRR